MATKKKGNLTASPEWARHLRPFMKKMFWQGERSAELGQIRGEVSETFINSVEELLEEIDAWNESNSEQKLFVSEPLFYQREIVALDIGMSIVLDRVLEKGYFPNGRFNGSKGAMYSFINEDLNV